MNTPFRSRPHIRPKPDDEDNQQIVEGIIAEDHALVPVDLPPEEEAPRRRRRRPRVANPGLLILALGLMVAGVFFTMMNVDALSDQVLEDWPFVTLGLAVLWCLIALVRRDATAFLGGAAIIGLSVSLLLDTQDVGASFEETVVGSILIVLGLAIVVRGVLLRSTPA